MRIKAITIHYDDGDFLKLRTSEMLRKPIFHAKLIRYYTRTRLGKRK